MAGPINSWKNKGVNLAAWETRNGGTSFTFQKVYRNKSTNEWIETKSYFVDELKTLQNLIDQALSWVHREPDNMIEAMPTENSKHSQANLITDDDDIPF